MLLTWLSLARLGIAICFGAELFAMVHLHFSGEHAASVAIASAWGKDFVRERCKHRRTSSMWHKPLSSVCFSRSLKL
jgi:hypothetical protein